MDKMRDDKLDLLPNEWKSDDAREKPKEPFFGSGAWDWLWYVLGFTVVSLTVRHFI